ncbi:MAG: histidine phosphatase family protein [Cardiobacteriaceae bacterium]|nr:histidine phosphatase family protein [Cardiobacteriaceae bacterium]
MIDRIFWRHAQAGFGLQDLYRTLTPIGFRQAEYSGKQLKELAKDFPVYTSQCLRSKQTAEKYAKVDYAFEELNPDQAWQYALAAVQTIEDEQAIIVGHMPWISLVIAYYLRTTPTTMANSEWYWLKFDEEKSFWFLYAHYICPNCVTDDVLDNPENEPVLIINDPNTYQTYAH